MCTFDGPEELIHLYETPPGELAELEEGPHGAELTELEETPLRDAEWDAWLDASTEDL